MKPRFAIGPRSPIRWLILALGLITLLLSVANGSQSTANLASRSDRDGGAASTSSDNPTERVEENRPSPQTGVLLTAQTSEAGSVNGAALGTPRMPTGIESRPAGEPNEREEDAAITPRDPRAVYRDGQPQGQESVPINLSSGSGAPAAPLSPTSFKMESDTDLGAPVNGNIIGEVSAASAGTAVLATWNGYSAISNNFGRTWTYYNPATLFAWSGHDFGGFCCDQSAYYDQTHDIMVWILQYSPDGSANNAIRFAWSKGAASVASASFCWVNLTPQQLGNTYGPSGTNYDQPKFARSDNDYYLQIQRYGTVAGSTILRFPISSLTWPSCSGFNYDSYIPNTYSPGMVQRAGSTMYFAGHVNTSTLRVYQWPEGGSVTTTDVSHTAYATNYPHRCPRTGGNATSDWCQRRSFSGGWAHSDRIFTAWRTGGYLYFMWDSTQGSTGWGTFTYPYIEVKRIAESTLTLYSEPHLWSNSFAIVYGSAALNDNLYAGGTLMWGGGSYYENCAVWLWDDVHGIPGTYGGTTFQYTIASDSDPNDTLSGDYASARRNGFNGMTWNGTCYALRGGGAGSNMHPHVFWFGRVRDFHDLLLPLVVR